MNNESNNYNKREILKAYRAKQTKVEKIMLKNRIIEGCHKAGIEIHSK